MGTALINLALFIVNTTILLIAYESTTYPASWSKSLKHLTIVALLSLPVNINDNIYTIFGSAVSDQDVCSVFSIFQSAERNAFAGLGSIYQEAKNNAATIVGLSVYQHAGNHACLLGGISVVQISEKHAAIAVGINVLQYGKNHAGILFGIYCVQSSDIISRTGATIGILQVSDRDSVNEFGFTILQAARQTCSAKGISIMQAGPNTEFNGIVIGQFSKTSAKMNGLSVLQLCGSYSEINFGITAIQEGSTLAEIKYGMALFQKTKSKGRSFAVCSKLEETRP